VCPNAAERRLAAILCADVVGYSRLMAEDEAGTVGTLTDYREEIAVLVRQHRGRVVDTAGDSALAEFPNATDAVECAVEVQGVLRVRNAPLPEGRRMEFRVGIHVGEVRVEGDRLYGDAVNIAARLEALSEPGGICISRTVYEQVRSKLELAVHDLGQQDVKNIPEPVHVYRVQPCAVREEARRPSGGRSRHLRTAGLMAGATAALVAVGVALTWPTPLDLLIDAGGIAGRPVYPPLPDRPSLVVLPFNNMSDSAEQEYFSDGITEDLTTDLSRISGLFVIARNSAFVYKNKPVNVEQVGQAKTRNTP